MRWVELDVMLIAGRLALSDARGQMSSLKLAGWSRETLCTATSGDHMACVA
jgi:hypothetical protein